MKRLLIVSGKGGTGKTTVSAAFVRFSEAKAVADCDVDAPNLHIVMSTKYMMSEPIKSDFKGMRKAYIDRDICVACGKCLGCCRYDAVREKDGEYFVDPVSCEGCAVCEYVCPAGAVEMREDTAGEIRLWLGDGVFSSAKLKTGRGNSGKLVTEVKRAMFANAGNADFCIVDGSPGIGCPVIASATGMDMALIVAEPSVSGLSDLKRLVKTAETLKTKTAVCVNKWDTSPEHTEEIEKYCFENGIAFLGKIPYDGIVSTAVNKNMSVAEIDCPVRDALFEIYLKVAAMI